MSTPASTGASRSVRLDDVDATATLAAALADTLPARGVIYLEGELGAGKTTLARALLRRLGVQGPVRSPTYTLVERYPVAAGEVAHLDLYRIADPEELHFLGLQDLMAEVTLWLVEWPERGRGALPAADLRLCLAHAGDGRTAELIAASPVGETWLRRLSHNAATPEA